MPNEKATAAELTRAIDSSLKAYGAGDRSFFDYLTKDARVYTINSAEPTKSVRDFEKRFGDGFKRRRQVDVVNRDIDARPGRGVVSQTLAVTADNVTTYIRQTAIWDRGDTGWKISHLHNAQVGQPVVAGSAPREIGAIRVLNERIATVAATVGVAQ